MNALPRPHPVDAKPDPDRYVLPAAVTSEQTGPGPRFSDMVWNVRAFLPRTNHRANLVFAGLADPVAVLAAKQFLESRLNRACPVGSSAWAVRPMKITGAFKELGMFVAWLTALRTLGVHRLCDARQHHLEAVERAWQKVTAAGTVAARITVLQHVAAHADFMTADMLTFMPWSGLPATQIAKRIRADENVTPRIPEHIMAPLLRAALFYIESASDDILAARTILERLKHNPPPPCGSAGEAATRIRAYLQRLRDAGKGIPALPREQAHLRPGTPIVDNVMQAPNLTLVCTLSGTRSAFHLKRLVEQAGREIGYQEGGLDCPIATWPDSERPWRAGFNAYTAEDETHHLRTAAWVVIAYLSGMRDAEKRAELHLKKHSAPLNNGVAAAQSAVRRQLAA